MQALQPLLNSLAFNVFLGTLPLLGMIFWGLFQNDKRLQDLKDVFKADNGTLRAEIQRVEGVLKSEIQRVEGVLGAKLDGLDARVKALENQPPLVTR